MSTTRRQSSLGTKLQLELHISTTYDSLEWGSMLYSAETYQQSRQLSEPASRTSEVKCKHINVVGYVNMSRNAVEYIKCAFKIFINGDKAGNASIGEGQTTSEERWTIEGTWFRVIGRILSLHDLILGCYFANHGAVKAVRCMKFPSVQSQRSILGLVRQIMQDLDLPVELSCWSGRRLHLHGFIFLVLYFFWGR